MRHARQTETRARSCFLSTRQLGQHGRSIERPLRTPSVLIAHPPREIAVSIDASIAQERPVLPHVVDAAKVTGHDQHILAVVRSATEDAAKWVRHKRSSPE